MSMTLIAAALLALPATAPETRDATAAEAAGFSAFHAQRVPGQRATPRFEITRPAANAPWTITALLDTPAYRGLRPLCRASRSVFRFDPQARPAPRWSLAFDGVQLAWLGNPAACAVPRAPVRLAQRLPDQMVIELLGQRVRALGAARLLFAGNSSCAPLRAERFTLAALEVGAPPGGTEEMAALVYDSARGTARVWLRQRPGAIDAWAVACSAPAP